MAENPDEKKTRSETPLEMGGNKINIRYFITVEWEDVAKMSDV